MKPLTDNTYVFRDDACQRTKLCCRLPDCSDPPCWLQVLVVVLCPLYCLFGMALLLARQLIQKTVRLEQTWVWRPNDASQDRTALNALVAKAKVNVYYYEPPRTPDYNG